MQKKSFLGRGSGQVQHGLGTFGSGFAKPSAKSDPAQTVLRFSCSFDLYIYICGVWVDFFCHEIKIYNRHVYPFL